MADADMSTNTQALALALAPAPEPETTAMAGAESNETSPTKSVVTFETLPSSVGLMDTFHVKRDGVSLEWLMSFAKKLALVSTDVTTETLANLTLTKECSTIQGGCAYTYIIGGQMTAYGRPATGPATHFVSHCWQSKFQDVVSAVEEACRGENPSAIFLWMDIFCVNLERSEDVFDASWYEEKLPKLTADIGKTILVVANWEAGEEASCTDTLFETSLALIAADEKRKAGDATASPQLTITQPPDMMLTFVDALCNSWGNKSIINFFGNLDITATISNHASVAVNESTGKMVRRKLQDPCLMYALVALRRRLEAQNLQGDIMKHMSDKISRHVREEYLLQISRRLLETPNIVEGGRVFSALMNNHVQIVMQLGQTQLALGLVREMHKVYKTRLDVDHRMSISAANNIASLSAEAGDYASAIEISTDLLKVKTRVLGAGHEDTIGEEHNLGSYLRASGEYRKSVKLLSEAYVKRSRLLGFGHDDTCASMFELIKTREQQGQNEIAHELYKTILSMQVENLGIDHRKVFLSRLELGKYYLRNGRLSEGEEQLMAVFEYFSARWGSDDELSLIPLEKAAEAAREMGKMGAAEERYGAALGIRQKSVRYGPMHTLTLAAENNLAVMMQELGEHDEASLHLSYIYDTKKMILGETHAETLHALSNYATSLSDLGRLKEAEKLFRLAMSAHERIQPADEEGALAVKNNLADVLKELMRLDEARKLMAEVVASRDEHGGADTVEVLKAHNNLGCIDMVRGANADALKQCRFAAEGVQKIVGNKHPLSLRMQMNVACVLCEQSLYQEAYDVLFVADFTARKEYGPDAMITADLDFQMAIIKQAVEREGADVKIKVTPKSVLKSFGIVVRKRASKYGPMHPETIRARHMHAVELVNQGDLKQSKEGFRLILDEIDSALGIDHYLTLYVKFDYGIMLVNEGVANEIPLISGPGLTIMRESVERLSKGFGPNHCQVLNRKCQLANVLINHFSDDVALGDEAETLLRTSLKSFVEGYGDDDERVLHVKAELARFCASKGDLEEASELFRVSRDGYLSKRSEPDALVNELTKSAAENVKKLRRWTEAEALYTDLVAGYEVVKGENDIATVYAIKELSQILYRQLKYARAEETNRVLIRRVNLTIGDVSPMAVAARSNLVRLLMDQEKFEDALQSANELVSITREIDGGEIRSASAHAMILQAKALTANSKLEAADEIFEIINGVAEGMGRMDRLSCKEGYADFLKDCNRMTEASVLYSEVLDDLKKWYGVSHPMTLRAVYNCAFMHCLAGTYEYAREYFKWVLERFMEGGAPEDVTISWKINLANTYYELKQWTEAEVLYEQISMYYEERDAKHPDYLATLNNLGNLYLKTGRVEESEKAFRECLHAKVKSFGDAHSKTLLSKLNLAFSLGVAAKASGDEEKASESKRLIEEVQSSKSDIPNFFMSSLDNEASTEQVVPPPRSP